MNYLTKVFHKVNDYPMPIINTVAQQQLNYSQSKIRRPETNEIKKLTTKMQKYIRKSLPENVQAIVT